MTASKANHCACANYRLTGKEKGRRHALNCFLPQCPELSKHKWYRWRQMYVARRKRYTQQRTRTQLWVERSSHHTQVFYHHWKEQTLEVKIKQGCSWQKFELVIYANENRTSYPCQYCFQVKKPIVGIMRTKMWGYCLWYAITMTLCRGFL